MAVKQAETQFPRAEEAWTRWLLSSAREWADVATIVKETGIPVLDMGYQQLVQYTLDLEMIAQAFEDNDVSFDNLHQGEKIFRTLIDYAQAHFNEEEKLMEEMKSPMLRMHRDQHAIFINMTTEHYNAFRENKLHMISGLRLSVLDWLIKHINVMDARTFTARKKRGRKKR